MKKHLYSRYKISARVEFSVGGVPMQGRSHAVQVILADVNHRQVPELCHVPGLEDLALRRRAVAVQREGHGARAVVLVSEGDTGTDWHLIRNAN